MLRALQGDLHARKRHQIRSSNEASEAASQIKTSVANAESAISDKASQLGQKATQSIDANRGSAANMLDKAASSLHDNLSSLPGGEKVQELGDDTAHKPGETADYVRTHDSKAMMADIETFVKSHPSQALIAAGIIGFLTGRAFTNKD